MGCVCAGHDAGGRTPLVHVPPCEDARRKSYSREGRRAVRRRLPPAHPRLRKELKGPPMYWLGIDIGTGGSRALLIDRRGEVKHAFTAPHEDMRMERPLWAEQRPENWWDAAQVAIRGVLAAAGATG